MGKFSDILLTVDFDRTLTAPDSSIPEENLRAIEYFMAEGGAFTLNTGIVWPPVWDRASLASQSSGREQHGHTCLPYPEARAP